MSDRLTKQTLLVQRFSLKKFFKNISERLMLLKQCFRTFKHLLGKHLKFVYQAKFERLATSQNIASQE